MIPLRLRLLAVFLSFGFVMPAQMETARVSGQITDPSGKSVPKAEVKIANRETGVTNQTATNSAGIYSFPSLTPGHYRVTVEAQGFKVVVVDGLVLNVQDVVAQNVQLEIGSVAESVTVSAGGVNINTSDGTVSTVIDRQFVENMPLNGRSFQNLILLTPGVVAGVNNGTNIGGSFSVNGQRLSSNGFMVDGVSANFGASPVEGGQANTTGNLPGLTVLGTTQSMASLDALQEFKVDTSTYSAEYGRQPGGQISIVTRSGTNELHGSAFEYLRNDLFDANDWFADRAGQAKASERQNDFGGTLGGPIIIPHLYNGANRTFFFFSYEGLRLRLPSFSLTNVPTLALRQQVPSALQALVNAFPLPNGKNLGNGLAELTASYSDPSSLDATSIRIDHSVGGKLTLFGRYSKAPSSGSTRRASINLATKELQQLDTQTLTIGMTGALAPHVVNDLRANYSTNGAFGGFVQDGFGGALSPPSSALIPSQYYSPAAEALVELNFAGYTSLVVPEVTIQSRSVNTQQQINAVDSLSYAIGSHHLTVGIDYRRSTPTVEFQPYRLISVFSAQQELLAAAATRGTVIASTIGKPVILNFSAYGQDIWQLSRRFSVDIGLRWDINPAPVDANGNNQLAVTQISTFATTQLASTGTRAWATTFGNIAPRLGAAYQIHQAPGFETVVRGGFGIFFDTGNDFGADYSGGFPYETTKTLTSINYPLVSAQVAPVPIPGTSPVPPYGLFRIFDPHLQLPYTFQWNLSVTQSLGKDQLASLSYVGAAGRRLLQSTQMTLGSINPNFTSIYLIRSNSTSDYDSLQAKFQRRLSRGLQGLVSYTWSHALDEDSSSNGLRVAERGNADFDVRQVVAAATTYEIPAPVNSLARAILSSWSIDGNFHAQSSLPVDLVANTVTNPVDGSLVNVRPNVNPGVPFYLSGAACTASNGGVPCPGGRRINPAAFNLNIPPGQSGDFGRNQVRGFGAWQLDIAVHREFHLHENFKLQFRAEAFNVFNHPNFGSIQPTLTAANFGEATNMLNNQLGGISPLYQIGGPRSMQFAIKLHF